MDPFFFGWLLLILAALGWDLGARAISLVAALMGILNILAAITPKP
ncbi:MAG: hypothetical protein Q8Q59_08320 [Luteolibacter sp.]|jgi:hypothetical protein|nr:hypothetical protein [Luteolibacter sp.]